MQVEENERVGRTWVPSHVERSNQGGLWRVIDRESCANDSIRYRHERLVRSNRPNISLRLMRRRVGDEDRGSQRLSGPRMTFRVGNVIERHRGVRYQVAASASRFSHHASCFLTHSMGDQTRLAPRFLALSTTLQILLPAYSHLEVFVGYNYMDWVGPLF